MPVNWILLSGSWYHWRSFLLNKTKCFSCEYKQKDLSNFNSTCSTFLLSLQSLNLLTKTKNIHEYLPDWMSYNVKRKNYCLSYNLLRCTCMWVCICSICSILALFLLAQVHISSLGRESSGSPILITENVTSATTQVTKVEKLNLNKNPPNMSRSFHYLSMMKWMRRSSSLLSK